MPSGSLVCRLERTGSTLLTQALTGTGVAGEPWEYFNPEEQETPWLRAILGDSGLVDGFSKVLMAGTTSNSMFGVKIHWSCFWHLGMRVTGEWKDSHGALMKAVG